MSNVFENISKDILFVAWYGAGVRAVDVSDLSAPREIAAYTYSIADDFPEADPAIVPRLTGQDTYDVVQGPTGHIYVSDGSTGLRVLEFNQD